MDKSLPPAQRCRHFSGYKPCQKNLTCDQNCPSLSVPQSRLLIIHLGALGAVLRSTSLLKAMHRKFPQAHITWVTTAPAHRLLEGNPLIDRIILSSDLLALRALEFDVAFVIDKSLEATGILKSTSVDMVYGFQADPETGAILPATPAAEELWELGLSNFKKFFTNKKSEQQLVHESLELGPYTRDPYLLRLTSEEILLAQSRRKQWVKPGQILVGLNTGCSSVLPHKRPSDQTWLELIKRFKSIGPAVVLLGGPEDDERNSRLAAQTGVINSPTRAGLRDGLASVEACDIVITGDSLGMHMAIALAKWTVVWFGPSCEQEIDLYERGVKVVSQLSCAPCWKRQCDLQTRCNDLVDIEAVVSGAGIKKDIGGSDSISR